MILDKYNLRLAGETCSRPIMDFKINYERCITNYLIINFELCTVVMFN